MGIEAVLLKGIEIWLDMAQTRRPGPQSGRRESMLARWTRFISSTVVIWDRVVAKSLQRADRFKKSWYSGGIRRTGH